jgi:hypothetical protein
MSPGASRDPPEIVIRYAAPAIGVSSSIYNEHTSWNVSNMMFARVLEFATDAGRDIAATADERAWVERLTTEIAAFSTYSPDVESRELFSTAAQCVFWERVLRELASRIYERRIGSQEDQTWQVSTIWAAVDLARVLVVSAHLARQPEGAA